MAGLLMMCMYIKCLQKIFSIDGIIRSESFSNMELIIIILLGYAIWALLKLVQTTPKDIGDKGEDAVRKLLLRKLNSDKYILMNDVIIPNPNSSTNTAQIDHIVLSVYGIFVIETKNYSGWIFGSPNARNWTQVVYHKKNQFQNPIKQNWGHIYALSAYLKLPRYKFHNIVCFVGDAEFKTEVPDEVYLDDSFVDLIQTEDTKVLTEDILIRVRNQLLQTDEESFQQ